MSEDEAPSRAAAPREPNADGPAALELVATGVALVLIFGMLGVLTWDAVHPNKTPSFRTHIQAMRNEGSLLRATLEVRNDGDDAAKAVVVHVELVARAADTTIAETDVTIDWLPGEASRQVIALLPTPQGPESVDVRADVRGYVVP